MPGLGTEKGASNKDCVLCSVGLMKKSSCSVPYFRGSEKESNVGAEMGCVNRVHKGVKPGELLEVELTLLHLRPCFHLVIIHPKFIALSTGGNAPKVH